MRLRSGASDRSAVPFPSAAADSLFCLSKQLPSDVSKPVLRAADALRAFRDAPAQRPQGAAVRLLVGILRKDHPSGNPCPLCEFVAPALNALLFESPEISYALATSALRVVLKARCAPGASAPPDLLLRPFYALFERLEARTVSCSDYKATDEDVYRRAADLRAVSTILGESETRPWISEQPLRLHGVCVLAVEDLTYSLQVENGQHVVALANLLDACRCLSLRVQRHEREDVSERTRNDALSFSSLIASIPSLCWRVLRKPDGQRRDVMAAAVLLVSATVCSAVLEWNGVLLPDQYVTLIENSVIGASSEADSIIQVFLMRAVVECPELGSSRETLVSRALLRRFQSLCVESSDVSLRFMCVDSLVLALRQLSTGKLPPETRREILELVEARWEESYQGISGQMREVVDALMDADGDATKDWWKHYALSLLDQYQGSVGMYAPLSRIVTRIGSLNFLQSRPKAIETILESFRADVDAAKPIGEWLAAFWRQLRSEVIVSDPETPKLFRAFADLCATQIVSSLNDTQGAGMCRRVALYVIPAFLRASSGCEQEAVEALLFAARELNLKEDDLIRTTIVVLSASQEAKGSVSPKFDDPALYLQLQAALQHRDPDIRLGALELIAVGRSTTSAPVSSYERDLIFFALPQVVCPGLPSGETHRIRGAICKFIARMAGSRVSAHGCTGWWERERKSSYNGKRTPEFESLRVDYVTNSDAFLSELSARLLAFASARSAAGRQIMSLELLQEVASVADVSNVLFAGGRGSGRVVSQLLSILKNKWDRPRNLALSILSSLPAQTFNMLRDSRGEEVLRDASECVQSPRLYEAESAAILILLVFRKAVAVDRAHVLPVIYPPWNSDSATSLCNERSSAPELSRPGPLPGSPVAALRMSTAVLMFLRSVLTRIQRRLEAARIHLNKICMSGLFFGDVRVLHCCMKDTNWARLCADNDVGSESVRSFMKEVFLTLCECGLVGLKGLDLNTNGFVDSDADASAILTADESQKIGTSCYLSVKEICLTLGSLSGFGCISGCLSCVPEGMSWANRSDIDDSVSTLNSGDFANVGAFFHRIFSSVRHNGVLNGATEGYEGVCRHLLLSQSSMLSCLPLKWAMTALNSAMDGKMYALRRSAGVSYFVLGAVRAEGHICQERKKSGAIVLGAVVSRLLEKLHANGFSDGNFLSPYPPGGDNAAENDVVVHSLNILRTIAMDSVVAKVMTRYLGECMAVSLSGFFAASWHVRNSAFMLFGALVKRAVGAPGERQGRSAPATDVGGRTVFGNDGRIPGVTPQQFFGRYPRLHSFLLSMASRQHVGGNFEFMERCSVDDVALYPVLYLLSSLSPGAESEEEDTLSMKRFEGPVDALLGSRVDCIRRMAALAWVPLICNPCEVRGKVKEALAVRVPSSLGVGGQNRLHGELFRLAAILKHWCLGSSIMTGLEKGRTVITIAELLPRCLWIATDSRRNPCRVTQSGLLKVLRRCAKLTVQSLLKSRSANLDLPGLEEAGCDVLAMSFETAKKVLDIADLSLHALGMYSIGTPSVARGATKLILLVERARAALGLPLDVLLSRTLLGHASSDVRQVALRMYADFSIPARSDHAAIWKASVDTVLKGDGPIMTENALRAACSASVAARDDVGMFTKFASDLATLWSRLMTLASNSASLGSQENSVVLLGHCLHWVTPNLIGRKDIEEMQVQWVTVLETLCKDAKCISTTRLSAAHSIAASGVLFPQPENLPLDFVSVRVRLLMARFLLDDNHQLKIFCVGVLANQAGLQSKFGCPLPDVLPAVLMLHKFLKVTDPAAVRYFEESLGLDSGMLSGLFCSPRDQQLEGHSSRSIAPDDMNLFEGDGNDDVEGKLFTDDSGNVNNEMDVQCQLAAWSMFEAASKGPLLGPQKKHVLGQWILQWTMELYAILVKGEVDLPGSVGPGRFNDRSELSGRLHLLLCRIAALYQYAGPSVDVVRSGGVLRVIARHCRRDGSPCEVELAILRSIEALAESLEAQDRELNQSAVFSLVCS